WSPAGAESRPTRPTPPPTARRSCRGVGVRIIACCHLPSARSIARPPRSSEQPDRVRHFAVDLDPAHVGLRHVRPAKQALNLLRIGLHHIGAEREVHVFLLPYGCRVESDRKADAILVMAADTASERSATRSSFHLWLPGTICVAPFSSVKSLT